mgnify:FL=1
MTSPFTALLHPRIDPTDTYDPTFTGITRKRRLPSPRRKDPDADQRHCQGKTIHHAMLKHNAEAFAQVAEPQGMNGKQDGSVVVAHPDVEGHRFGRGFHRRHVTTIGTLAQRELETQRDTARKAVLLEKRRELQCKTAAKMNPLTGGPPIVGSFLPPPPPAVSASRAKAIANARSDIFSAPTSNPTPAQLRRRERLQNEGLTHTKKDWSVKNQLQCWDGFVLPKLEGAPQPSRDHVVSACMSTRPW